MKVLKGDIHRTLYKQPELKQLRIIEKLRALFSDS